ncbi:MAG: hypothetical protein R3F20_00250 [Planctomycetota bacterium]
MNDREPRAGRLAKDLGRQTARGLAQLVLGVVALAAGLTVFLGLGGLTGFWSPALGLFGLAAVAAPGYLWWRRPRHLVATVVAVGGGLAAIVLGATDGLGLQVVLGAAMIATLALFWTIVEIVAG